MRVRANFGQRHLGLDPARDELPVLLPVPPDTAAPVEFLELIDAARRLTQDCVTAGPGVQITRNVYFAIGGPTALSTLAPITGFRSNRL